MGHSQGEAASAFHHPRRERKRNLAPVSPPFQASHPATDAQPHMPPPINPPTYFLLPEHLPSAPSSHFSSDKSPKRLPTMFRTCTSRLALYLWLKSTFYVYLPVQPHISQAEIPHRSQHVPHFLPPWLMSLHLPKWLHPYSLPIEMLTSRFSLPSSWNLL